MYLPEEPKIITFKKTIKQLEADKILVSNALHNMFYGGSRSGKTFHIVRAILMRASRVKSRHCALRKHFIDIKQSIWLDTIPKVFELCFPELYPHLDDIQNNHDYYLKMQCQQGGVSEFWIGGLDDAKRAEKILGKEYASMFFNECSQFLMESIDIAKTRLAQKTALTNKFYYDMNPPKKKHWSYLTFIKGLHPETKVPLNMENYKHLLMNPMDNVENLATNYLEILDELPESKKKRFRDGQFSDDTIGEVFDTSLIKRLEKLPADVDRIIVALDPAVTSKNTSDEHGIIVCARKGNFGYVIYDNSGIYTPQMSAKKTVAAYHEYECDRIIGEVNNGGDYIETVLRSGVKFNRL